MSQTISNTIPVYVSKTNALWSALCTGVCGGIATGAAMIISIVPNIYIVGSITQGPGRLNDFIYIEFLIFLLTVGSWLGIASLCGRRAAKKTGQGAKVGAYSGFCFGFTSVFSAAVSAVLAGAIISPGPIDFLATTRSLLVITTILACIASVIGSLFGAIGGKGVANRSVSHR